jgi:hypothetical protein
MTDTFKEEPCPDTLSHVGEALADHSELVVAGATETAWLDGAAPPCV